MPTAAARPPTTPSPSPSKSKKKDLGVFPHAELPAHVAAVIEAIETDIIRGIILPSTRLIEDHLMEDYDAKRHVVRAALVELCFLAVAQLDT